MQKNTIVILSCALALFIQINSMDTPKEPKGNQALVTTFDEQHLKQLEQASFSELPQFIQSLIIKHATVYLYLQAVKANDLETTKTMLSRGVPVDASYEPNDTITPLMHAVKTGSPDIVNELLKHNANCNLKDKAGNSAKSMAINAVTQLRRPAFSRIGIINAICLHDGTQVPESVLAAQRHWGYI